MYIGDQIPYHNGLNNDTLRYIYYTCYSSYSVRIPDQIPNQIV